MGDCALGRFAAAWSDSGLCAIALADTCDQLQSLLQADFPGQVLKAADPPDAFNGQRIAYYLNNPYTIPKGLPLNPQGTAFQQRVWRALADIPPGRTVSYAELACRLNKPKAARAVAGACGANKLAVLIPCHRVVRSDGSPGGYRWGLARKRTLLHREKTHIE